MSEGLGTDWLLSKDALAIAAKAVADHHAHRLDYPEDPNEPMDEDYDVAQAVLVAVVAAIERSPRV